MKKIALLSVFAAFLPFLGFAHEGHGQTNGFTITHYFVEPEHLIVLLIIISGSVLSYNRFRNKQKRAE